MPFQDHDRLSRIEALAGREAFAIYFGANISTGLLAHEDTRQEPATLVPERWEMKTPSQWVESAVTQTPSTR